MRFGGMAMHLGWTALAEKLLRRTLGELGTHALVLLDPGGLIVGWLAGAERLFGYTAEEVVGKNVMMIFTPEDVERRLSAWEIETARGSGESEDDRWQVRKDGGRIWVSGTLTALHDEAGVLLGFAKIMRNRTDQKFQVETLEGRIDGLQKTEERKNRFISTLAHELRNPIGAISSAIELLGQGMVEAEDLEFTAGVVKRQVEFMERMIGDLLEATRAAAGKVQLHKERVVMQEVVGQAVETCRVAIDGQKLELRTMSPQVEIALQGDATRLRQVLVNLIQNASKFTPAGGTIWVTATTEGNEAVVRVQDTGIGIAPEMMPHIFDLFTQAEGTGRKEKGLGIGLAVVKETVALHGGSVQATSDGIGKGSEFTVRLPLDGRERADMDGGRVEKAEG